MRLGEIQRLIARHIDPAPFDEAGRLYNTETFAELRRQATGRASALMAALVDHGLEITEHKQVEDLRKVARDLARPHDCVKRDGMTPLVLYVSPENVEEVVMAFREVFPDCMTVELP